MKKISILLFLLLASCGYSETHVQDTNSTFKVVSINESKFVPGFIVPTGTVATKAPPKANEQNVMPFNEVENASRNMLKNKELRLRYQEIDSFPDKQAPFPKDDFSIKQSAPNPNWGARISQVSSPVGNRVAVYAAHEVKSISFSTQTYEQLLYAPTLMPPNNAIVESTLYYWRPVGASGTTRVWGVWDHIQGASTSPGVPGWGHTEPVDSTFLNKYVRNHTDGRDYFYTQAEKLSGTSQEWRVMLYNYITGGWDIKYTIDRGSAVGGWSYGWDIHEPKFFSGSTVYCPTLPSIKMKELQVWNGSTWNMVDSSRGSNFIGSVTCSSWTYTMVNNYYEWVVN